MKHIALGVSELRVPNVILGMMRIPEKTDEEIRDLVRVARDHGIDYFDHADIYGGALHRCETRFAEALQLSASDRAQTTIQTKTGIVPSGGYYDFSYEHIVESAEASLRALQTDYIDVFLLHRPDTLVEPAEVARAFDELASSGKVRAFGVSNHTPGQIELLKTAVEQPLLINQMQLSMVHAPLIAQGIAANVAGLEQSYSLDNDVLNYSRINRMTLQTWGPIQSGKNEGPFLGSEDYPELNAVIERLAEKYEVTPLAIATAWITRHPAEMQVVIGSTTPSRVSEAAAGSELPLTRQEWYELFRVAGHVIP
ncbi:aldo/keto reductase [Humidisolicoccus flavus]|uniref:aldo/keto reductase n=1 Tax=Humidisolicoccus flavus TaxID=3111414 RepID=UPI00324DE4E8